MHISSTKMWSKVPNFVILCLGQFVENVDLGRYSLNHHWSGVFNKHLPQYPHIRRILDCTKELSLPKVHESTEYRVSRVEIRNPALESECLLLCRFTSIRHISIRFSAGNLDAISGLRVLVRVVNSLETLETIALNLFDSFSSGDCVDFVQNLPLKVTSLNLGHMHHLQLFEKHFLQLVHFDAPYWGGAIDRFCFKMTNLQSLAMFGTCVSFECFRSMPHLQKLKYIEPSFTVQSWNQFVDSVSPGLCTLELQSVNYNFVFETVLLSEECLPLLGITEFSVDSGILKLARLEQVKRIFPRLSRISIDVEYRKRDEEFSDSILQQMHAAELNSVTISYLKVGQGLRSFSKTYHKGDNTQRHLCPIN